MELRRAILLFAIILGLAAIATSVQRPASDRRPAERETRAPSTAPSATARARAPVSVAPDVSFEADLQPETERVALDRATTLTVTAVDPGEVEIPRLGLSGYAEPGAPARFDLLLTSTGRYEVFFSPTDEGDERRKIGNIEVSR